MSAETIVWIVSSFGGSLLLGSKLLYGKAKYKKLKKNIYSLIKKAKEELNEENLIKGIELLKKLDEKNKDFLTGDIKKGFIDKFLCKPVLSKMDKLEKLFGLSFEDVKDEESIKQFIKNKKEEQQKILKEEEEAKDELKIRLEQLKNKQLMSNVDNRKVVDEINLTQIIKDIHKEYSDLFMKTFKENIKNKNIVEEETIIEDM